VTRRAFGKGRITGKRWRKAADEIATELQALKGDVDRTGWRTAIGSSGTVRAVQRIVAETAATLPRAITLDDVERLRAAILSAGHVERVALPGLSGKRQPVIAGGVLVLESCMRAFGIERLEVSPFALREGLLYDMVGRLEHRDPREKTVRAMAERFEADAAQAERVRDFALCAFEQIAEAFDLRRIHRDLLDWSCRLHEIGLGIAHSHYQVHSAYVVEHSDMPGFTRQEQQFMAFLLRFQRRRLPENALEMLPQRLRPAARPMLALLRLAVALCRSRIDADLPDFSLLARGSDALELAVPSGWLAARPLSARSLELERRQMRDLGLTLRVETLASPHPLERTRS
jgi:exopolyphosphatase/guanosine-5'-triphosphate,3'-diphosphate pyrophosphatase